MVGLTKSGFVSSFQTDRPCMRPQENTEDDA